MRWRWCLLVFLGLACGSGAREPHQNSLPIRALLHLDWQLGPVGGTPEPFPLQAYAILQVGSLPCRLAEQRRPFRLYNPGQVHQAALQKAIDLWNRTGLDLGLGYLFTAYPTAEEADLVLNWSDPRLPKEKAAATWWRVVSPTSSGSAHRRVLGLSIDGGFAVPEGNRAQILAHELGHVLGLGESNQVGDMMYFRIQTRRLQLGQLEISLRDKLALRWLYQQKNFAAIIGRRD